MNNLSRWQFADSFRVDPRRLKARRNVWIGALVALLSISGLATAVSTAASVETFKTYTVPKTVTRDCSRDVTSALNSRIASLPEKSTLTFPANGCYRIDGTIAISDKHSLTIDGGNSRFKAMTDGSALPPKEARTRDQFLVRRSSNITIKNAIAYGANPHAGSDDRAYVAAFEAQHGFEVSSSSFVTLDHVQAYNVYGDFVYIGGGTVPSHYVTLKNSTFRANGRIGVSVVNATDVLISHNVLDQMRRSVFDLEPFSVKWIIQRVTIQNNTVGRARLNFFSSFGGCAIVDHISVLQNRLVGQELNGEVVNQPTCSIRRTHFTFSGNTSDTEYGTRSGMALKFVGVDAILLTNNVVPLAANRNMHLARLTDSRWAIASGNVLPSGTGTIFTNDGSNIYCASNNKIGDPLVADPTPKTCAPLFR
jgi:hypothetical protein